MGHGQNNYTFDKATMLKDAGLVAADAAATVASVAKIWNCGNGRIDARVIVDATAVEVDTGNESYEIIVQGSKSASFASGVVNLASRTIGDSSVLGGGQSADSPVGRYEIPFTNEVQDTRYEYIRLYTNVTGTLAAGINYTAYVVPNP